MRGWLLVAGLLVSAQYARAQAVEVYGTISIPHVTSVPTGSVCSSGCTEQYTSVTATGVGGGVTLRLVPLGLVDIGLDLRGSTKPGNTGVQTAMVGLRAVFKPPVLRLRPYLQGSAGYFATQTANQSTGAGGSTFSNSGAAYEAIGGLDVPVLPVLDLRVVEIGAGQAFGLFNGKTSGLVTVNAGVVLHF